MLQEVYSKAIDDFVSIMEQVKAERQKNIQSGKYVNVFSLWNNFSGISEPIHSRILQFFLSANPMHGQGNKFIHLFLKRIGVKFDEGDEWYSTAEIGRVDVMLKRFHPRSVVIIENKSNWAVDQPNQLYRYWYENIHHCFDDCFPDFYETHPEYKAVYLVPKKDKIPSDDSLQKPSDYPTDLPDILPMKPLVLSFDEEVATWLDDCVASLPKENTPLINLILQYKEYCKNFFILQTN